MGMQSIMSDCLHQLERLRVDAEDRVPKPSLTRLKVARPNLSCGLRNVIKIGASE